MSLKIYYITDVILDDKIVHAAHVDEVSKNLVALGHQVTLYAPKTGKFKTPRNYPIRFISAPLWLVSPIYQLKLFFQLRRDAKIERPDVIYVRQGQLLFVPTLISKSLNIPIIFEVNGRLIEEAKQVNAGLLQRILLKLKIINAIERFNVASASNLIVVSMGIKEYLIKEYGLNSRVITVISNGVDTDFFKPMPSLGIKKKLNLDENATYIGYIGSLHSWQGVPYAIEAAKIVLEKNPSTKFLIVGDGGDGEKINQYVKENNLHESVEIHPAVAHELIPEYINALDVCLSYPLKIRASAASPFKVYEYLACGKAVVVSDIGGIKEEFGNAVAYAEAESSEALAATLSSLIGNENERLTMGKAAREFIQNGHSWHSVALKTVEIFKKALAEKK